MGRSKKKKSSRTPPTTKESDDGMIRDERFQIAQTHPQFQKRHTKKKDDTSGDGGGLLLSSSSGKDAEAVSRMRASKKGI